MSSAAPAVADQWHGRLLASDAEAADDDSSAKRWRDCHGGRWQGGLNSDADR
ncbi:hypothetical protein Syun_029159 [Stephania yunnanensis]|uniref:Uncharacterized protein n=1 Tax=Stephania yunnanensis TaxID=152371 RepID=A0AAP0E7F4_9MAGN